MSKSAKTTVEKIESIFYRYCRDSEVLWNSIFTRLDDDVLRFGYKSIQTIFTCTEGYMRPIIFKKQGKQFEPNLHEGIPVETEHLSLFYKDCRVLEESEYLPEAKKGTACFLKIDINPLEGSIYFRKTNHGSDTCKHEIDLNLEDDDNDPDTGTGRVLVLPRSEMYTFHFKLTTFWEKIIQKAGIQMNIAQE
ncbi:Hypothetical protein NTJ_08830 [Nesidiocoris tenuis]|uniref:Uncharacterized protein n=1 Tax=Nesidiocoris tenuis TaxID=355587 RepID=A0ABN7AV15_9HEMI|nr:Hypothetical protein NTJ_08830 [Nesidiocoris tenuis]